MSKIKGRKTKFSRRMKQFNGLTGLTLTPIDRSTPLAVTELTVYPMSKVVQVRAKSYFLMVVYRVSPWAAKSLAGGARSLNT